MMKTTFAALALSLCLAPAAAFAKGGATTQNHHCKLPDGSMDMGKTHKQCTAAKGQWVKDAAGGAGGGTAPAGGGGSPAGGGGGAPAGGGGATH